MSEIQFDLLSFSSLSRSDHSSLILQNNHQTINIELWKVQLNISQEDIAFALKTDNKVVKQSQTMSNKIVTDNPATASPVIEKSSPESTKTTTREQTATATTAIITTTTPTGTDKTETPTTEPVTVTEEKTTTESTDGTTTSAKTIATGARDTTTVKKLSPGDATSSSIIPSHLKSSQETPVIARHETRAEKIIRKKISGLVLLKQRIKRSKQIKYPDIQNALRPHAADLRRISLDT